LHGLLYAFRARISLGWYKVPSIVEEDVILLLHYTTATLIAPFAARQSWHVGVMASRNPVVRAMAMADGREIMTETLSPKKYEMT
jgi:hypothetical protein